MYVFAFGFASGRLRQQVIKHSHVQDADGQAAPGRTVVSGTLGHELRRFEASRLPDAVGYSAEAEQILRAVCFDAFPGIAGGLLAVADALDGEVRSEDGRETI